LDKLKPYLTLLADNRNFRNLWLSQIISNFGDWFGLLAVYALFTTYSDSALLLGLVIVVKMLSLGLFSPIAGYLTDKYNRRRLMIICDILRGIVVAGFLVIHSQQMLWLAYPLMAVQMMLSSVFEPAKSSSIPNITSPDELVKANVLSALSWSVIFTAGMGMGGLATAYLGTNIVFVLDVFSYLISAWFIYDTLIPQNTDDTPDKFTLYEPYSRIKQGFSYLKQNRHVLRPALAKGAVTCCLGGLVYMLILISEEVLMLGSIGVGLLYASRGLGTAAGPIIGKRIFDNENSWVKAMGFWMIMAGLMYVAVGLVESLLLMVIFVFLAHLASGANWVMSTVLLQRRAPDYIRGRVFSFEWLFFTLAQSLSVFMAANIREVELLNLPQTIVVFAVLLIVIGFSWLLTITKKEHSYQQDIAWQRNT